MPGDRLEEKRNFADGRRITRGVGRPRPVGSRGLRRLEAGLDLQLAVYGEARGTGGAFC